MNSYLIFWLVPVAGLGFALLAVDVRECARRIRRAWLRRFPRWRVVGEPIFMAYAGADRLLRQAPVDGRVWRISASLEDRNQMVGHVWVELVERVWE